jgi:uncharacterized protein (DUF3084 family)
MVIVAVLFSDPMMAPALGFLTGWLIMGTICTIWLALHVRRRPSVHDLEDLHRAIDRTREQLRSVDPASKQASELRFALLKLMESLPDDDLRRRLAS